MLKRIFNKLGLYRTYALNLNGHRFRIPVHKGLGMANFNDPESWMIVVLSRLGSSESTLVDVGVNVGQTLLKWKALFPQASYIGFEPNTSCVTYVKNLIRENKWTNCNLYDMGISAKAGISKLYLLGNDQGDSSASIIPDFRENEKRREIPIKLTTFAALNLGAFDILKIDVEGSELGVIQSLFETEFRPIIVLEILPVYSEKNTARLNRQVELESLVHQMEYQIFRIEKSGQIRLNPISQIGIHHDMTACDYVLIPSSKKEFILSKFSA